MKTILLKNESVSLLLTILSKLKEYFDIWQASKVEDKVFRDIRGFRRFR